MIQRSITSRVATTKLGPRIPNATKFRGGKMLLTLCIISGACMQVGEWQQEIAEFAVHALPLCMSQLSPTGANNFSCMKYP